MQRVNCGQQAAMVDLASAVHLGLHDMKSPLTSMLPQSASFSWLWFFPNVCPLQHFNPNPGSKAFLCFSYKSLVSIIMNSFCFFQPCILFGSLVTVLASPDCMVVYFLHLSTGDSELNILSKCKYCCSVDNTIPNPNPHPEDSF